MSTMTEIDVDTELLSDLREIELGVLTASPTLADLIREGSKILPVHSRDWGSEESGCALSAAYAAGRARGLF